MPTPVSPSENPLICSVPETIEQTGGGDILKMDVSAVDRSNVDHAEIELLETEVAENEELAEGEASPLEPGSLLKELEARQDEVLESLDELDRQICEVLRNCGVTLESEEEQGTVEEPIRHAA